MIRSERGVSTVIGALFIFAFFIVAFTAYQATVVPDQNAEVEFNAYQEGSTDMQNLRADVLRVANEGGQANTMVATGTQYPARSLAMNPGPSAGSVSTSKPATATLENVESLDAQTADFWTGDDPRSYDTQRVRFTPNYARLDVSPVAVGGQLAYRDAEDSAILLSGQSVVQGNRISLISVAGDVDTAGLTADVAVEPVSVNRRTVSVRAQDESGDDNAEPLVVTIPSDIPASTWENELLAGQPRVENVTQSGDKVRISLKGDKDTSNNDYEPYVYELNLAKVEVRAASSSSRVADTQPTYLTDTEGDGADITTKQTAELTAEVRDKFNNPKAGVEVKFTTSDGEFAGESDGNGERVVTSDESGSATIAFEPADDGTTTVTAEADIDGDGTFGENNAERVTFSVEVRLASGSSTSAQTQYLNSGANTKIYVTDAKIGDYNGDGKDIRITLKNDGSEDWEAVEARFPAYFRADGGSVETVKFRGKTLEKGGPFISIDPYTVNNGQSKDVDINDVTVNGGVVDAREDDFVVLSVIYENTNTGERESSTYFIQPADSS
jgi:uncharacterized protein (DUF2141 family)